MQAMHADVLKMSSRIRKEEKGERVGGGCHTDRKVQSTSKCLYLSLYSCMICTLLSNVGLFNFGTAVKFEIVKYAKQI